MRGLSYKYTKGSDSKMKVVVCIGSSCHIKGSRLVVERLQELIAEHGVGYKVDLSGTFCLGKCVQGGVLMDEVDKAIPYRPIRSMTSLRSMFWQGSAHKMPRHGQTPAMRIGDCSASRAPQRAQAAGDRGIFIMKGLPGK